MAKGSCFCGKVRISYPGEPVAKALCHCLDCRKISGSAFSTNLVVPEEGFAAEGDELRSTAKTADTGSRIETFFCGGCGSTLFRDSPGTFPGLRIVKAGVLDEPAGAFDELASPAVELFTAHRAPWLQPIPGAEQKPAM